MTRRFFKRSEKRGSGHFSTEDVALKWRTAEKSLAKEDTILVSFLSSPSTSYAPSNTLVSCFVRGASSDGFDRIVFKQFHTFACSKVIVVLFYFGRLEGYISVETRIMACNCVLNLYEASNICRMYRQNVAII